MSGLLGLCLIAAGSAAWAQQADAAGAAWVAPAQRATRPEQAPRLEPVDVTAEQRQRRLAGVEMPWPGNLPSVARQGSWYSPMFKPGMSGRYDLRGWHPPSP